LPPWDPAFAGARLEKRIVQILPLRVVPFDQLDLPGPLPLLQLQFAIACFLKIVMRLVPNKEYATMLLRETVAEAVAMLIGASGQSLVMPR
jgi:hypothetical protein